MGSHLIFITDDDYSLRRLLEVTITSWGYETKSFNTGEALLRSLDERPDVVLLDHMLPGMSGLEVLGALRKEIPDLPVIMLSAQSKIDVAVEIMRSGATDYFSKPVDLKRLQLSLQNAVHLHTLREKVRELQDTLEKNVRYDNIVSSSGVMQDVLKMVERASRSDITVLIEGESGTGKELIARAIHYNGVRKDGPFIIINCAAIPRDLLESELFGHERGAFTGAIERKIGKFEAAHGGTIFLDEIGEMDATLQAKLLRVIQERQFERVGGVDTIRTDVRIISATNRNLRTMAAERQFREDLYYRLSTFPIIIPPLRDRAVEIPLLADHFLNLFATREGKAPMRITPAAYDILKTYPWPGNVRELQSVIERSVILSDDNVIGEDDLPLSLYQPEESSPYDPDAPLLFRSRNDIISLEKIKESALRRALLLCDGNASEAARLLEIGRTTLYDLVKKYGIPLERA
ncbi:MAG: sigma-54 dependent transcriptional regulator [Bacteroidia bacterium]|nr:sigma-54 dependent transcriptional regulator [Bacteroidia bacterium]